MTPVQLVSVTHDGLIAILEEYLPGRRWDIRKPEAGWRKASYIASNGQDTCFVKFDVPVRILKRLGDIGVAPRVLFSGQHGGVSFVLQEFVQGVHPPSQAWMRQHVGQLAAVVKAYHEDEELRTQLAAIVPSGWHAQRVEDLEWLSERLSRCDAAYLRTDEIKAAFERLVARSNSLEIEPLVAIHNDPSPTNILLAGGKFVFLDWDEIALSDPMRDIGLLLWWNFPPDQWRMFFDRSRMELTSPRLAKIYWFAARASLDIALWHAEHGVDGQSFVADFLAALDEQPNPQGY